MFALLQTSPDETLSAYFVPFRAPIWQEMQAPADTLAFARELWRILLAELEPEVLVVNGADAFDQLATVLPRPAHVFERPAGWGNQRVAFAECGGTLAIRIPTLSRFKLFSRAEGRVAMEDVARRVDLFRRRSDEWRRP
ncbi:hypothetical protein [Anaeromyxobacter oryzisoli]|uniref:hypothetical protein n=1 Tax=Anaeromyxobacter oryzisoli TaxID=2925408 RepID=UPI001F5872A7|nr:hypothetical protein [Anaeromyxobacter sp. SG63]